MPPRVLLFLLLPACAGPSAHRTATTNETEASRPAVASTLGPADPLAAANCGLPTAPAADCADVTAAPEQKDEGHHHGHGATPAPAEPPKETPRPKEAPPTPPPPAPAAPKKEDHHHQHSAPPSSSAVGDPAQSIQAASVADPVCKMTIDPSTAKGGTLTLKGTQYWFCSSSCRRTFLTLNPEAK